MGILKQAIDPEFERFRSACVLLGSMAGAGRLEAGLYLIGLLGCYASDLQRGAAWTSPPRVIRERTLGRDPARQEFEYHSAILGPGAPISCCPSTPSHQIRTGSPRWGHFLLTKDACQVS